MGNTISLADLYNVAALVRGDIPWPMLFPFTGYTDWPRAFADYERWRNHLPSLERATQPLWTTEYRLLIRLLAPQLQGRQVQVITSHWLPFWITGCWKYLSVFGWPDQVDKVTDYISRLAIDHQAPEVLGGLARNQSVLWLATQYAFCFPNTALAPASVFIEWEDHVMRNIQQGVIEND